MTPVGHESYWDILVADTKKGFRNRSGLDFGGGCGRNVQNLWSRFARMDGADISAANLAYAQRNILAVGCEAAASGGFGITHKSRFDYFPNAPLESTAAGLCDRRELFRAVTRDPVFR